MCCPQTWFDPILQRHARSFPHISMRYQTKLESFVQDPDGVTATLTDQRNGNTETVRCQYLVGCDGFASTVRALLSATTGMRPRSSGSRARARATSPSTGRSPRMSLGSYSIAPMLAALWFLADAAEEGKDVVLSMLVVGLVFLAVIALGELTHYAATKRRRAKLDRPL